MREMGREACRRLFATMDTPDEGPRTIEQRMTLTVRESTSPPSRRLAAPRSA
jgi:DNA-binding LacI/PurR family transcriptional regulator